MRGAIRVEQQLTGQSVLIPQAGDVLLPNGQLDGLRTSAGQCACELQIARATPPQVSQLASAEEARRQAAAAKPNAQPTLVDTSPAKEEPIYQVFMPPLVYDANAKVQPEIDPRMIILVRRVRVCPRSFSRAAWKASLWLPSRRPSRQRIPRSRLPLVAVPSLIVYETSSASCGPAASDL